jgi:RNA polymerase sigma-70 factor (ECF subfamily)
MYANKPAGGSPGEVLVGEVRVDTTANGEHFNFFIHQQYGELLRFVRTRTNGAEDSKDVAQESIVKLLRYREAAPAADWRRLLYRIAINAAHDRFRDARHFEAIARKSVEDRECTPAPPSPDEFASHQQRLAQLRRAILELPPKCQRVFLLKIAQDMTNAEIAQHCGVSVKMVEKHLAKGLDTLRRKVGNSA